MEGIGNLLLEDSPLYGVVVKHAFAKTVGKPFGRTHAAGPAPVAGVPGRHPMASPGNT